MQSIEADLVGVQYLLSVRDELMDSSPSPLVDFRSMDEDSDLVCSRHLKPCPIYGTPLSFVVNEVCAWTRTATSLWI